MIQEPPEAETIRTALQEVLTREGIPAPPRQPSWLEQWLSGILSDALGIAGEFDLTRLVLFAFAVFLVALVVGLIVARLRRARPTVPRAVHVDPAVRRARARELWQRARAAEGDGELVLALRLSLFALVVALGEDGALDFRPAWTDRELLARGAPPEEVRRRLEALLDELEPKTYGLAPTGVEDLRRLERLTRELAPEVAA